MSKNTARSATRYYAYKLREGLVKKKKVITQFVKKLTIRTQTQKNQDKRARKRLRNLAYNS